MEMFIIYYSIWKLIRIDRVLVLDHLIPQFFPFKFLCLHLLYLKYSSYVDDKAELSLLDSSTTQ